MYDDLIRVITPRAEHTGPAILQMARYGDVFLDSQFDDGSDRTVFEYELLYGLGETTGGPEGLKIPQEGPSVVGVPLTNLGDDKEAYRLDFIIKNNRDADDYSGLITALKAVGQPAGGAFDAATESALDVDEWLRAYALSSLCGPGDNYGGDNAQHNLQLYTRPSDRKTLFFIWDTDFAFFRPPTDSITVNSDLNKFIATPANRRRYYCHLLDIITTTYNSAYMGYWTDHYDNFLPGQNFSSILTYIGQRASFVAGQLPTNAVFAINSNGGNNFTTTNGALVLAGTAPLNVKFIEVNGVSYPLTWTSVTNWTLNVPLFAGVNSLAVQGVDNAGIRRTNFLDTITVTNNGPGALLPVVINEWMADNAGPTGLADPADGLFQDWFELFNPNTNAINLGGYFLTDEPGGNTIQYTLIPNNGQYVVPGGGYLLVWADGEPAQNGPDRSDFHASFKLSGGGESLALISPDGVFQHVVTFGQQFQNVSQGLFPDGNTNTLFTMPNWTPRASNRIGPPPAPQIDTFSFDSGVVTFTFATIPGRTYHVEYKDNLDAPVWTSLGPLRLANSTALLVTDTPANTYHRFYRVLLSP
jgi:hypothetical protein